MTFELETEDGSQLERQLEGWGWILLPSLYYYSNFQQFIIQLFFFKKRLYHPKKLKLPEFPFSSVCLQKTPHELWRLSLVNKIVEDSLKKVW